MDEMLRPMSTSELLDRTFSLYRKNFLLFAGIASLGPAAYLLVQLLAVGAGLSPVGLRLVIPMMAGFTLGGLVMMIGVAISHGATVKAVAAVHLGRQTSIVDSYRSLKGRIGRVLAVFFAVGLLSVGGGALLVMATFLIVAFAVGTAGRAAGAAAAIAGGILGFIAIVIAAVLAIGIFVRYSLAVQACVVENLRVSASLRRSALLSKGSRGRILTVYAVFAVLGWFVAMGIGMLSMVIPELMGPGILSLAVVALSGFVSGCLTGPLATIGMSLVYYDERVRKEAFDLQLMMAALEPLPEVAPAPAQ
jgi:hypothetical protein